MDLHNQQPLLPLLLSFHPALEPEQPQKLSHLFRSFAHNKSEVLKTGVSDDAADDDDVFEVVEHGGAVVAVAVELHCCSIHRRKAAGSPYNDGFFPCLWS